MFGLNTFQILFLAALILMLVGILIAVFRGWASRREGFVGGLLCLSAIAAMLWPKLTAKIANLLGIGRGADLVFYCAVVVMMIGFWMTYMRMRHLRRELTLLVRHIAILEMQREHGAQPPPPEPSPPKTPA